MPPFPFQWKEPVYILNEPVYILNEHCVHLLDSGGGIPTRQLHTWRTMQFGNFRTPPRLWWRCNAFTLRFKNSVSSLDCFISLISLVSRLCPILGIAYEFDVQLKCQPPQLSTFLVHDTNAIPVLKSVSSKEQYSEAFYHIWFF